jgi:hypothetical protein
MSTNSGALVAGTGNSSAGSETVSGQGAVEVHAATSNATGSLQNLSPPESLAHTGGIHGFYDALSLHPGVWFLFGCIFIVSIMIVREIYYKKKVK